MIQNNLKLNHGTFDYYILKVTSGVKIQDIQNKFLHFKTVCEKNKNIILDFVGEFNFDNLSNLLANVNDAAKIHGLNIHSIIENPSIKADSILGFPVISLPHTGKIPHIYNKTIIIDEPVRSGIKIEHDGDIVVTTFVSDNAEIVAAGNIHIYGEARGRIVAGSDGNKQARIFIQSFNPELISISGIYKTLENELPQNIMHKAVMITLDEKDRLLLTPLTK